MTTSSRATPTNTPNATRIISLDTEVTKTIEIPREVVEFVGTFVRAPLVERLIRSRQAVSVPCSMALLKEVHKIADEAAQLFRELSYDEDTKMHMEACDSFRLAVFKAQNAWVVEKIRSSIQPLQPQAPESPDNDHITRGGPENNPPSQYWLSMLETQFWITEFSEW